MALNIADKVLIDFAIKRFNENNLHIEDLPSIAKELNRVFAAREREMIVKKYAVKQLVLFDEKVLLQNYELNFTKKEIVQKSNGVKVLDMRDIYDELNESLKSIGSNVKIFKTS
ncbi:MAG: hypothetical protein RL154_1397 [Pseudomonadota bacterium]|jgi:hypothetical protein